MTDRDLMQQALDALQTYGAHSANCEHLMLLTSLPPQRKPCSCGLVATIITMRERLAQPNDFHPDWDAMAVMVEEQQRMAKRIEELEAQPEQEPVAWEDVLGAIARGWTHDDNKHKPMDVQLAVAIAKEIQDMVLAPPQHQPLIGCVQHDCAECKARLAQPEQEPVAYMSHNKKNFVSADDVGNSVPNWTDYYPTPLYTTPSTCPTCEALARTVMMDQAGRDA
jgi:hypothetical protein